MATKLTDLETELKVSNAALDGYKADLAELAGAILGARGVLEKLIESGKDTAKITNELGALLAREAGTAALAAKLDKKVTELRAAVASETKEANLREAKRAAGERADLARALLKQAETIGATAQALAAKNAENRDYLRKAGENMNQGNSKTLLANNMAAAFIAYAVKMAEYKQVIHKLA